MSEKKKARSLQADNPGLSYQGAINMLRKTGGDTAAAQRALQVRHRLSGAALLGIREPTPPTMAIDAAPRAGDTTIRRALPPLPPLMLTFPNGEEIE